LARGGRWKLLKDSQGHSRIVKDSQGYVVKDTQGHSRTVVLERQLEYHFHALDFENEAFSKPHAHGTHSHTVITLEA